MKKIKNLYLIRHAKASWEQENLHDFERPLTEVGKQDAHLMGAQLKARGAVIDCLLASSAARAITTATIIAEELEFPVDKIATDEQIYNAGVEELIARIKHIDKRYNSVACVGHNPSLTWLFHYLCEGEKASLPTCGIVNIQFTMADWSQLSSAEGKKAFFIHPEHEVT
jgi:phosphohistidine phosphatase